MNNELVYTTFKEIIVRLYRNKLMENLDEQQIASYTMQFCRLMGSPFILDDIAIELPIINHIAILPKGTFSVSRIYEINPDNEEKRDYKVNMSSEQDDESLLKYPQIGLNRRDLKYKVDGGYENAERQLIYIFPYYIEEDDVESDLRVIQIEGNFKFKAISHRDYLGALLNLGIKREKIGDIIIHENFCQVIVSFDICDFILMNLEKVSNNNVKLKEISREDIIYSKPKYKDVSFTVTSSRLDCIISGLYNISRQESSKLINNEKVQVNYEKITSCSKEIKAGCLISVRGKGRSQITSIGGLTKKGKIKVQGKILL